MNFSADLKDIRPGDIYTFYDKNNKTIINYQVIFIPSFKKCYSLLCLETSTCVIDFFDKKEDLLKYLNIISKGLKMRKRVRLKMKW